MITFDQRAGGIIDDHMRDEHASIGRSWRAGHLTLLALFCLAFSGCEEPPADALTLLGPYPQAPSRSVSLRRLTTEEFAHSIHDVLGAHIVIPPIAEPDVAAGGLLAIGAGEVSLTARGTESIETAVYAIAAQALDDEAHGGGLLPCTPGDALDVDCARQAIEVLGLQL